MHMVNNDLIKNISLFLSKHDFNNFLVTCNDYNNLKKHSFFSIKSIIFRNTDKFFFLVKRNLLNDLISINIKIVKIEEIDIFFKLLKNLKKLKELILVSFIIITQQNFSSLNSLSNLQKLEISNSITSPNIFKNIKLNQLNYLELRDSSKLDDECLYDLKNFTNLKILFIKSNIITNKGLSYLGSLTNLNQLNLSSLSNIDDNGLIHLKKLEKLTILDLGDCINITDDGLDHLNFLTELKYLNLSYCKNITSNGLVKLDNLKKLKYLYVKRCNITENKMELYIKIKRNKKQLAILL